MTNNFKTQEKKVLEKLLADGRVTRNWALQSYITRLGAIIYNLKSAGWDIDARYERTHGGYGKGKDYVYVLINHKAPPKEVPKLTRCCNAPTLEGSGQCTACGAPPEYQ